MKWRHWCPCSEAIAGCDALMGAFANGWQIEGHIFRQTIWLGGARPMSLYHFSLVRGEEHAKLGVVENPALHRMVNQEHWRVIQINERKVVTASA